MELILAAVRCKTWLINSEDGIVHLKTFAKTLANIQVSVIFHMRDIARND